MKVHYYKTIYIQVPVYVQMYNSTSQIYVLQFSLYILLMSLSTKKKYFFEFKKI